MHHKRGKNQMIIKIRVSKSKMKGNKFMLITSAKAEHFKMVISRLWHVCGIDQTALVQ